MIAGRKLPGGRYASTGPLGALALFQPICVEPVMDSILTASGPVQGTAW